MKVAIYARVSTSHHEQNSAVQVNELTRYCDARRWCVHEVIVDEGYSGGSAKRPGLQRVLELARQRRVDSVIVLKMDRLFRSLKHMLVTLEEFESLGIAFVAIKDHVDMTTPAGKLMTHLIAAFAEFERSLIRERTMLGLQHAIRQGKRLGRPLTRPEGRIRALHRGGLSYRAIASKLGVSMGAVSRTLMTERSEIPENEPSLSVGDNQLATTSNRRTDNERIRSERSE